MTIVSFKVIKPDLTRRYNSKELDKDINAVGTKWAEKLQTKLSVEPPEKAGSTYVRTHSLSGSFKTDKGSRGDSLLWWRVFTSAVDIRGRHYSTYVVGRIQTAMHQATGWLNLHTEAKATQAEFTKDMQAVFDKWAGV